MKLVEPTLELEILEIKDLYKPFYGWGYGLL